MSDTDRKTSRAFDDFERVDELLRKVLETLPEERTALLEAAASSDPDLAERVQLLLRDATTEALLEPAGGYDPELWRAAHAQAEESTDRAPLHGDWIGRRLGAYEITEEIGRGGMAVVYRGERRDGVYEQDVAIKLLAGWRLPQDLLARFVQERQILARLEHPHIARLLDGGSTEGGLPYLVMEFVRGVPLDTYCDQHRLSIAARLELFVQVTDAVQFAHRNLVVHRDLKPSNILVTEDGTPKLLDFGIAKFLAEPEGAQLTGTWNRLLTPQYASPEQLLGEPISTASDVYALGLLLYELLTGRRAREESTTPAELLDAARTRDPKPISSVVANRGDAAATTSRALARRTTPTRLRQQLRGDLETVVQMALRREPERRYGSARELGDELRRHLDGLPVLARGSSLGYRLSKFARRRAGWLLAAAAIVLSLVAGLVTTTLQASRANREAARATSVTTFLVDLLRDSDPETTGGREVTVREVLDRAASTADRLDQEPELRANLHHLIGQIYGQLTLFDRGAEQARLALEERRQGGTREEIAESADLLAQLLTDAGEHTEAEALAREALELRTRASPATRAATLATLAKALHESGRADEAREHLSQAISLLDSADFATTNIDSAVRILNLAARHETDSARFEEANEYARRAIELGRDHLLANFETISAMQTLADSLHRQGGVDQLREAEKVLLSAIDLAQPLYGEGHPSIGYMAGDVATIRARLGDAEGGEQIYRDVIEATRRHLGEDHPMVATALNNFAVFYYLLGRHEDAIPRYAEAIALRERILGPEHPLVGTTRSYLGLAQHRAGDPQAEATYRQALEELLSSRGPTDEKVGNLRTDLGTLLVQQRRYAQAEPQLREAREILLPIFGEQDARTDNPLAYRGLALCALGRVEEGQLELAASRQWRDQRYPEGNPNRLLLDLFDAVCHAQQGQQTRAAEAFERTLSQLTERIGAEHRMTTWARSLQREFS